MHLFFADDSFQKKPMREGMGSLLAIGGIDISEDKVKLLDNKINEICAKYKFPKGQEFKWSPGRELWMRDHLKNEERKNFFMEVLSLLEAEGVRATVVVEDVKFSRATISKSDLLDLANMFLERASFILKRKGQNGTIIFDRPSGNWEEEDKFLSSCMDELIIKYNYVDLEKITLILFSPSNSTRLIQCADLIVGCTLAVVAGESKWSPPIFEKIKKLFWNDSFRIGGIGLKIHPDMKYANLYHWLLGDNILKKGNAGVSLPWDERPYFSDPYIP